MRDDLRSTELWRQRAQEIRTKARQMTDPPAQRLMLQVAASYDKLAEFTESRHFGRTATAQAMRLFEHGGKAPPRAA